MPYDCVVIKNGHKPFIHEVNSDTGSFDINFPERQTFESFSIQRIEEVEESSGRLALYIVANKSRVDRDEVSRIIKDLKPKVVRYFD